MPVERAVKEGLLWKQNDIDACDDDSELRDRAPIAFARFVNGLLAIDCARHERPTYMVPTFTDSPWSELDNTYTITHAFTAWADDFDDGRYRVDERGAVVFRDVNEISGPDRHIGA